jgi:mannose-1-phosphate guanylyltransferase
MLVLPADQRIEDEAGFRAALNAAAVRAARGELVTLGIRPTRPETGFGYVLATGEPDSIDGRPTYLVERFVEKPSADRAAELLAGGRASWNAGIFVWRRDAVRASLREHAPDIASALEAAVTAGPAAVAAAYPTLRATSIDYALLEPASLQGRVAVVPAEVGWSDLGSWSALLEARLGAGSTDRVASHADQGSEVLAIGSSDVLVHAAGGRLVVVVGMEDAIVVDTPDALLVCAPNAAQDVKKIVDRLIAEGRRELL